MMEQRKKKNNTKLSPIFYTFRVLQNHFRPMLELNELANDMRFYDLLIALAT